jgi:hypothetical protein
MRGNGLTWTLQNRIAKVERRARSRAALLARAAGGVLLAALLASTAHAQSATAALPKILIDPAVRQEHPLPDFSYAGYRFGLAPLPSDKGHVIDATAFGVVANDGKDDAKALLRAIAAAEAHNGLVTVRLPPGRVQIGEIIPIERSHLVLEGAGSGADGTELFFPRPLKIVDASERQNALRAYLKREDKLVLDQDQNINVLFSEYSWSGGFLAVGPRGIEPVSYAEREGRRLPVLSKAAEGAQFGRRLKVASTKNLQVGQVVQVQWYASEGPRSGILRSLYGDIGAWNASAPAGRQLKIGSHHWTFKNRPVVAQSTRITAIDGNAILLGDELLHAVNDEQPAVLAAWPHLTEVGIQGMRLTFPDSPFFGHHVEQGYNGIYFTGVFDGWIRDLVVHNADSAILTDNAASLTIADVTTTGARTGHYSVHVGAVHNVLVRDLRVENPVVHPLSVNTRSTRSVYQRATVLSDSILDQHSGSNHQNLFDQPTLTVRPKATADGGATYRLWVGGGADYWKPGHAQYNTHWNVRLVTPDAAAHGTPLTITSGLEGPGARIVGLHADGPVTVDYAPNAYVEGLGAPVTGAPSLYDYQLAQRRARTEP